MLFVSLLQPKGRGMDAIKYLKALKAPKGITSKGVYFTYGWYDGIIMFEATGGYSHEIHNGNRVRHNVHS